MGIHEILDQIDEIVYISDLDTHELLYLNRYGRLRFGDPKPGVKCYEHLQNGSAPCEFCTNKILEHSQGNRHTWVRQHPTVGSVLLHDSIVNYDGKPCRMEIAVNVNRYVAELNKTKMNLDAERKLVQCIEGLVLSTDFDAAVNSMLETIIEHYKADRAYVFEFDWEHDVTHNTYEICREGVIPQIETLQSVPIDVVAFWAKMFKTQKKKIIIIEDVDALQNDPNRRNEYDILHPQNIKNLMVVPIFVSGELHGFLGVDNPTVNTDTPELLTQVTYIAANELQKRLLTEELTTKSYHDPLTNLQNRLAYDEQLELLLGKEIPVGVGFLDLNGLKWLNDNLGYDMGNKAIRQTCRLLQKYVDRKYIYRISGDEFVLIWPNVGYVEFTGLMAGLEEALDSEQHIASLGYVWGREEDVGIAVRKAEQAMQTAKNKFYAQNSELKGQRPGYLDVLLQEYKDSKFVAYLQPLYSIQKEQVYGAEVLVRKIDPRGFIHTPIEFIKIMEREHMIAMVDFEMLRQSCALLKEWKTVWPGLILNVNFSRNTLTEPHFLEQVDKILADTGADPSQLIFEITESSQGIQLESLSSLLDELRKRNIKLAIDDLGTEAACLEMLYLPQIGIAKIDRSLICKAEHSAREQTVIHHLISLCHDLKMICVAEGIETQSQVELLKKLGCDRLQGYFIGKPMTAEDFMEKFAPKKSEDGVHA